MKQNYKYAYTIEINKDLNDDTIKELDTILGFYGFKFKDYSQEVKTGEIIDSKPVFTKHYVNGIYFIILTHTKYEKGMMFNSPIVSTIKVFTAVEKEVEQYEHFNKN